jgi:acyl dehydratase
MSLSVGIVVEHAFKVEAADMTAFERLSGDRSSIHSSQEFARSQGYRDVIVYGGIMLAKLSFVLGTRVPGDSGVSTRWTIDYRKPLYVGEDASIRLEIIATSPSTGLIESRFSIRTTDRLVASGKTQSLVPRELLA